MKVIILSMAIFAVISTILILIDSLKTRKKINEIISKHNLLVESLQKIEKEVEKLKNKMK